MTTTPLIGVEAAVAEVVSLASELIAFDTTNTADPAALGTERLTRRKVAGSAGATILGDGSVALILDVHELFLMQKSVEPKDI